MNEITTARMIASGRCGRCAQPLPSAGYPKKWCPKCLKARSIYDQAKRDKAKRLAARWLETCSKCGVDVPIHDITDRICIYCSDGDVGPARASEQRKAWAKVKWCIECGHTERWGKTEYCRKCLKNEREDAA